VCASNTRTASTGPVADNRAVIETLAGMLARGEYPENYDDIIKEMSDDDIEHLWAVFIRERYVSATGGDKVP
jgi:hypothetical protein